MATKKAEEQKKAPKGRSKATEKKPTAKAKKVTTSKNKKPGRPCKNPPKPPLPEETKARGAPTKYRKEYDEQVYKLCLLGMIDSELADFFEVEESTINNWKKDFPSFLESMNRGKKIANAEVAAALYKRATGFERPDSVKIFMPANASKPVYAKYTEYFPPDASAAFRFLNNREPEKWRDKREVKLEGMPEIGVLLDLPKEGESDDAEGR